MEINIKIKNPIKSLIFWFNYNIVFWRIIEIEKSRLGAFDIDREYYKEYIIQHIFTGKTLSYHGWGSVLKQHAIYRLNGEIEAFKKSFANRKNTDD